MKLCVQPSSHRLFDSRPLISLLQNLDLEAQDVQQNFVEALEDRRLFFQREREEALDEAATDFETCCRKADQHRLECMQHLQINFEHNFHDVKRYYQELTYHNLSLIQDIRGQSSAIKRHVNSLAQRLRDTQARNKKFHQPMQKREQQLAELKKQVELFSKDEAAFCRVTKEISILKNERAALKHEISELESECQSVRSQGYHLQELTAHIWIKTVLLD